MADLPNVRLYNTLTRQAEELVPREPGKVSVYCCGPTTYDLAHVGHARAALAPDLLVRVLRRRGFEVTYVRNITDIDDKILARALERGEEPTALSARMAASYQEDMAAVGCERPTREPKVSEHLPQIVSLVETLVARGAAYVVKATVGGHGDDVYFRVRAFDGYGKLSHRRIDDLRSGERVEVDERKEDPLDFALWKGCAPDAWGWDSPWGRGRPGWHIECSAMSAAYLGHGFDVHMGGMDLVFPHHENEIAQSEAAHPGEGPFARCWVHNGFVNVDKEKMSKSLGNFFTVRDILSRNDPDALRLFLLSFHYRGPVSFDVETLPDGRVVFPGVDEAERKTDYLYGTLARLDGFALGDPEGTLGGAYKQAAAQVTSARDEAFAALGDDLGAAAAIAALYRIAAVLNEMLDLHVRKKADRGPIAVVAAQASRALRDLSDVLGLLKLEPSAYFDRTREQRLRKVGLTAAEVERKVVARTEARKQREFARADELRAELEAIGIELFDGPSGTSWRKSV